MAEDNSRARRGWPAPGAAFWVPDTHHPDFAEECRRQSCLASQTDMADADLQRFLDEAPTDIGDWSE